MASLLSLCRQCRQPFFMRQPIFQQPFSSTSVALASRHKPVNKIRVPSKKAAAAKARRKAAIAEKAIDKSQFLTLENAIAVLRAVEVAHPTSILNLYVKAEVGNGVAVPKGRINLPREAKAMSEDKILVFAEGRAAEEARRAGAHYVGGPEMIDGVINKRYDATTILCTPDLLKAITPKLGRVLGPLGLMPSARRGTVTDDIAGYISKIKGTSEWRADKKGNIHMPIAMMNFPVEDMLKNIRTFMTSVKRVTGNTKEAMESRASQGGGGSSKIQKVMLSSRRGPGIQILDY